MVSIGETLCFGVLLANLGKRVEESIQWSVVVVRFGETLYFGVLVAILGKSKEE